MTMQQLVNYLRKDGVSHENLASMEKFCKNERTYSLESNRTIAIKIFRR